MKGTPTSAIYVLLNLPPTDIFIMGEPRVVAYKMHFWLPYIVWVTNWQYDLANKHIEIDDILQIDVRGMILKRMLMVVIIYISYTA